jgi:fructose-1,6-bisphosphatase I
MSRLLIVLACFASAHGRRVSSETQKQNPQASKLKGLAESLLAVTPSVGRVNRFGPIAMTSTIEKEVATAAATSEIDSHGSVMTLTRYMIEQTHRNPEMAEMESLMTSIQMACKTIANLVARAGIQDLTGLESGGGSVNVQGEEQKKLDVISNTVMKNALRFSGKVGVVGSEEEDAPVLIEEAYNGKYVAVFDPLDGSSNIDAAISTGTIFGIFEEDTDEECLIEDFDNMDEAAKQCLLKTLQPGRALIASGYCMYSSSTILVLTLGNGVNGFTLDPNIGEFVLTHPNIQIPQRGKIYSINEANYNDWDPALQDYVNNLKSGKGESGEKYSARYIGSMVGDVHRTLLYGGIFGYPGDAKNPDGKLRLLYEGAPMSFILEQAGGKSTTGSQRVMDISPNGVHQRVPVFLGSADDIDEVSKVYAKAGIEKNY